jgi:hypothetical protein
VLIKNAGEAIPQETLLINFLPFSRKVIESFAVCPLRTKTEERLIFIKKWDL